LTQDRKRGDRITQRGHEGLEKPKTPPPKLPAAGKMVTPLPKSGPLPGSPNRLRDDEKTPNVAEPTYDEGSPIPSDATAITLPPFVEVELVYERGPAIIESSQWRALEIWTRNRIYGVDWSMSCIEVIDRETSKADPKHPLLGARLAGGQARDSGTMELTYPCPRPGCEAVFEHKSKRGAFSHTSTVLRVVLRLRVVTVQPEIANHRWAELTGAHKIPPPRQT